MIGSIDFFQRTYFLETARAREMWPKTIRYRDMTRKEQLDEDRKKHRAELQRISKRSKGR